uniref:Uncharacterized protein n=1 Tax=uncultured marine group II/III euryarchaeote AD1000_96_B04 TaxID=1457829 RepID=A0A075G0Y3_9EURY|nr:hypothetical protein [uncultured marine group II/III euryarchaeote AD1000_96_B04]
MTLHQLPEQNHSQCEYGDPNRKELGPQQRALESFPPRQRLHPSVPHHSLPYDSVTQAAPSILSRR